jgi:hypothetical protein
VAWDHFRVLGNPFEKGCYVLDEPVYVAPMIEVYEWEHAHEHVVAHMYDIRLWKEYDTVTVGMTVREVDHVDFFTVEMNRKRLVEGDHRQGVFGERFLGVPKQFLRGRKAFAYVGVGDDRGLVAELCVAADVIPVPMGVQQEGDLALTDFANRGSDFVGEGGELVIDHENPVLTNGNTDVAAGSFEHVNRPGDVGDLDLNVGEIPLRIGNQWQT